MTKQTKHPIIDIEAIIEVQGGQFMRLVVKEAGRIVNEFQFEKGPVYIGRRSDSHIFLPNRVVSRHHAVIFNTQDGKWMVEDLGSANKTYLNEKPIQKTQVKTGDLIRITDYTIEINLEKTSTDKLTSSEDTLTKTAYNLDDTLSATAHGTKVVVRKPDSRHGPDIKLPPKRIKEFIRATEVICKARAIDEVMKVLLHIAIRQFSAYHAWCCLRNLPNGEMICHGGRKRDGTEIQLDEIKLKDKITQAVEDHHFLLFPRIPAEWEKERIHSAMIAPIIDQTGCFGVLYIDNAMDHEHYRLSDLDYLMLLSIHTAAIIENF